MQVKNTLLAFPLILLTATFQTTTTNAATREQAVWLLVQELKSAGATGITMSHLPTGMTVIQASFGDTATVVSLAPDSHEIDYLETFDRTATEGFFGRRSGESAAITEALRRYAAAIGRNEQPSGIDNTLGTLLKDEREIATLGFSNERQITTDAQGAEIRTETRVGVPEFRIQNNESSFNTGEMSRNAVSFTADINLSQSATITELGGVTNFDQPIFTNPEGFKNGILVNIGNQNVIGETPIDPAALRANIIDSTTNSFANFPTLTPPTFGVSD